MTRKRRGGFQAGNTFWQDRRRGQRGGGAGGAGGEGSPTPSAPAQPPARTSPDDLPDDGSCGAVESASARVTVMRQQTLLSRE